MISCRPGNLFVPKKQAMKRMKKDIPSINKDFKYQRAEWPIARIFWTLVAGVLIYGLLGGFGDGETVLNRKTLNLSGSHIEYDRYLRVEKNFTIKIFLSDSAQNCSVGFNKDYIDKVQITQVIPEPKKVELKANKIVYTFSTSGAGTITFFNDPLKMGNPHLELEVNGKKASISQFIYF